MIPQFANQVMSSFLLFLDNKIGVKGQAYENVGTNFYLTTSPLSNYATYSAPYKQIVADQSVGGTVFTGISFNGVNIPTGVSGLYAINYDEGQLYFSSAPALGTTISGNYSIKDFNFYITDRSEEELLFETKYVPRPKTTQTMSGLGDNQITYPCIFLNNINNNNQPYELGGNELTTVKVQAIILADSQYKLDAVRSILADTVRMEVALFNANEWPFDNYGGYKSGIVFNYTGLAATKTVSTDSIYIMDNTVGRIGGQLLTEFRKINPCVFPGVCEFDLVKMRRPRA